MVADTPAEVAPGQRHEAARIRWATLADAGALAALYQAADASAHGRALRGRLEQGGALVLEDARGRLLCALSWQEQGDGWALEPIATLPEARGQGYGRWLMTRLEALAIRANVATLTLSLQDARDEVLAYYGRMGYAVAAREAGMIMLSKQVGGTWQFKR